MSASIRYDVSLGMRLLRAVPVTVLYLGCAVGIFFLLPRSVRDLPLASIAIIGGVGAWRYLWLVTHCVRAAIYEHWYYPRLRAAADDLPTDRKYPRRLFLVIPTFGEKPDVSRRVLDAVLSEAAAVPAETTIIINAGSEEEDAVFREAHVQHPCGDRVNLMYIRQQGGKRQGLADALYELADHDIDAGDALVLMDGDTVLGQGILQKCLPLFALRPKLSALTVDNISNTTGNWLYRKWYTLRFSLRHRYMKSQSLSRQLLVLTGRFSMFRARYCVTEEFIACLENDRIQHWLHGEIPFVTGDDKSTWFSLLKQGREMLYVPDAHIFCMENSGPQPLRGSLRKMHRWFGNMFRNNGRAIRLGLGRQSPFIWWCHVDQRISMWTSLIGPVAALWTALWYRPEYLLVYAILVILMRTVYLLWLTLEGHRMSLSDIFLLLYTQWIGSLVKIYTLFHLHRQKWDAHRQADQGPGRRGEPLLDGLIPKLQIAFSLLILLTVVGAMVGAK